MTEVPVKDAKVHGSKSLVPLPQDTNTLALVTGRTDLLRLTIKKQFKRDKHYGQIQGTKKDTLYKPGAELILGWHKIFEDPDVIEHTEDWGTEKGKRPFFHFLVRSTIYQYVPGPNGEPVRTNLGSAIGEANTGEPRYSHRWMWPSKMSDALKNQAKAEGWETREARNGGKQYKCPTEPEEIRGQYNTILKMAQIRALRSSLAKVCATSEFFGEDDAPESWDVSTTGSGTTESPEVVEVKKTADAKPKPSGAKTTQASGASPKQVAELKFIKDVLAKDADRFKITGKNLFGEKYKGKGWSDWSAEDITKFKEALSKRVVDVESKPVVDVETGELQPSASQGPWDGDEQQSEEKAAEPPKPDQRTCVGCQAEMTEDRVQLYVDLGQPPKCPACAQKESIAQNIPPR